MSILQILSNRVIALEQLSRDNSCEIKDIPDDKILYDIDHYIQYIARGKNTNNTLIIIEALANKVPLIYLCCLVISIYTVIGECEKEHISLCASSKDPLILDITNELANNFGEYNYTYCRRLLGYIAGIIAVECLRT